MESLGWSTETISRGGRKLKAVSFPDFKAEASIPSPHGPNRFLVFPNEGPGSFLETDGQLGSSWFAGKIWTFDYGDERLLLHDSPEDLSFDDRHTVPLAFRTDSTGTHVRHHPRIQATIPDSTYSFLFDTGATFLLSDKACSVGLRSKGEVSSSVPSSTAGAASTLSGASSKTPVEGVATDQSSGFLKSQSPDTRWDPYGSKGNPTKASRKS